MELVVELVDGVADGVGGWIDRWNWRMKLADRVMGETILKSAVSNGGGVAGGDAKQLR
jgi:hypothetical protein